MSHDSLPATTTTAMSIPAQQQAVVLSAKAPFQISSVDVPKPGPGQVLVKLHAVALNPVDWKIQKYGIYVDKFPAILGTDGAGEVVALGEWVSTLAIGDRVLFQGYFTPTLATFQQYTLAMANTTAKIPEHLSYEDASTIPVVLAAVALGLYPPKPVGAGLIPAWEPAGKGKYSNQPFLSIGGSSSVGQLAIQLAKLSGFSPIITTASLNHAEYLKNLGATHVIDRQEPLSNLSSAISKITSEPLLVAFDAISQGGTQQAAYDALGSNGQIVLVLSKDIVESPESGKAVYNVFGSVHSPVHKDSETALSLYSHLTELLEVGAIKANQVHILPNGLQGIITGLEDLEAGVSAVKLVAQPNNT